MTVAVPDLDQYRANREQLKAQRQMFDMAILAMDQLIELMSDDTLMSDSTETIVLPARTGGKMFDAVGPWGGDGESVVLPTAPYKFQKEKGTRPVNAPVPRYQEPTVAPTRERTRLGHSRPKPTIDDIAKAKRLYLDPRSTLTAEEIAKEVNVSHQTIPNWAQRYGWGKRLSAAERSANAKKPKPASGSLTYDSLEFAESVPAPVMPATPRPSAARELTPKVQEVEIDDGVTRRCPHCSAITTSKHCHACGKTPSYTDGRVG